MAKILSPPICHRIEPIGGVNSLKVPTLNFGSVHKSVVSIGTWGFSIFQFCRLEMFEIIVCTTKDAIFHRSGSNNIRLAINTYISTHEHTSPYFRPVKISEFYFREDSQIDRICGLWICASSVYTQSRSYPRFRGVLLCCCIPMQPLAAVYVRTFSPDTKN